MAAAILFGVLASPLITAALLGIRRGGRALARTARTHLRRSTR